MNYYDTLDDLFSVADFSVQQHADHSVSIVGTIRATGNTFDINADTFSEAVYQAVDLCAHESWLISDILNDYGITIDQLRALVGPNVAVEQTTKSFASEMVTDELIGYYENLAWEDGYRAGRFEAGWYENEHEWTRDVEEYQREMEADAAYNDFIMGSPSYVQPMHVTAATPFDEWDDWDELYENRDDTLTSDRYDVNSYEV